MYIPSVSEKIPFGLMSACGHAEQSARRMEVIIFPLTHFSPISARLKEQLVSKIRCSEMTVLQLRAFPRAHQLYFSDCHG
jgi:hypothetical protein